jgi:hypothetical protein
MKKTARRGRVRLLPYVPEELAERLANVCSASGVTESAFVEGALRQCLDGTSDKALLLRRLDRLGRAVARDHRDLELLSEAFAVFVRMWFAHAPRVREEAKRDARELAETRYKQFVQHVAQEFSGGRRFLDDLPRESIASDAELDSIAADSASRPQHAQ